MSSLSIPSQGQAWSPQRWLILGIGAALLTLLHWQIQKSASGASLFQYRLWILPLVVAIFAGLRASLWAGYAISSALLIAAAWYFWPVNGVALAALVVAVLTGILAGGRALGISGKWIVIAIPFLWLFVFFLVPFLVVGRISLSETVLARPPYSPLWSYAADGTLEVIASWQNFTFLFSEPLYVNAYIYSIRVAAISTVFALLIGYPMAYFIARSPEPRRSFLLLLVILPFWTSFLLRVYAWIGFLRRDGWINFALQGLGIIDEPLVMMQTEIAVYVGIVYTYLPFMILPLYANLVKLDGTLLEAASDLGASPIVTFLTVTLPLSLPGIVAGSMLVFIPAMGEYVIPALLGPSDMLMIGRVLWDEFFSARNWPVAAAVAMVMLVVVVAPIMWLQSAQNRQEER